MAATGAFVLLDKPAGMFSRTAGGRVARMIGIKKFGHIGTLDPMASGVLPIAIGDATKMIPFVEDAAPDAKEYLFGVQFGFETDTLDITGSVVRRNDVIPDENAVRAVLADFIGETDQVPPMYSAVHVAGRRAYELARRGAAADMPVRRVRIDALELLGVDGNSFQFRMRCARGTYVRAVARDIAAKLGAMATVDMIRRTMTNGFLIKNAVKLDFLENLVNNGGDIGPYLMKMDFGLGDIPVLNLDGTAAEFYKNGGFVDVAAAAGRYRVYSGNQFIGIGAVDGGVLRPKRTI